jgi:lysophospholipase L1-like esterase
MSKSARRASEESKGFWDPWSWSLLRAVFTRIGAVIGAAAAIGLGHDWNRWVLLPLAVVLGGVVFWVWRKTRQRYKEWWAYLIYILAIVVGAVLLTANNATRDLGVPPPVAVFGGLGAVFAGYAGLLSMARGSALVRKRGAVVVEIVAMLVAVVTCWVGLLLLERSRGSNPVSYLLVAAAVLVLYVALSLLSESVIVHKRVVIGSYRPEEADEVRWERTKPQELEVSSWLWPAGAMAIVLTGVGWVVFRVNFSALIVGAVVVCLILLFFAVAADGIADIAAVLVVVSLAWSLAPRTETFETEPITGGQTVLIALGDSYISGEGATRFYDGTNNKGLNECRRAPSAYAPLLVERATRPNFIGLVFLACSGAKAANLDARVQYEEEPPGSPPRLRDNGVWERGASQLEQLDEVLRAVRPPASKPTDDPEGDLHGLVLVSLGGNDAGFGRIATSCVSLGDCGDVVDAWTADLALVGSRLDRAYDALRGVIGPRVPVLVVPYPVPMAEERCDVSPMTQAEHTAIRGFVEKLNAQVAQAATDAGFFYLDIQSAFEGHRICDTDNADDWYLNYIATNPTGGSYAALSNPRNWFHNSFHPNAQGHVAIADAIEEWMTDHQDEIVGSRFELPDEPFRLAYLPTEAPRPSERFVQIGSDPCTVSGSGWEGEWTTCETARVARRFVIPSMLFVVATWLLAFTLLHAYRRLTDPRPITEADVGTTSSPEV